MPTAIYINLPVADLKSSVAFFKKLGYGTDKQFTNDDAAAVVISDTILTMLHAPKSFKRFLPKGKTTANAKKNTEVLIAIQLESKAKVKAMMKKVLAAGGTEARPPEDHGFMYACSFNDLDGHVWEPFWMDAASVK